jgi:hypothetical protein
MEGTEHVKYKIEQVTAVKSRLVDKLYQHCEPPLIQDDRIMTPGFTWIFAK